MSVVIVGAGPAGLAAATRLRHLGVARVTVIEREREAGGVPRHCAHSGFGLPDLHRICTGPAYAGRWVDAALRAGVDIRTSTTVTGWAGSTALRITSAGGVDTLDADAVLIATGCRERPRSARLVPGTRPLGVFTTGSLQQLVHLHHAVFGRRAVVVGAEHVSFSAVLTLRQAGCATVAMVTEHVVHQTWAPLAWLVTRGRIPILTDTMVSAIAGSPRVTAVDTVYRPTGERRRIECDTVVFTGDWIPDHELARGAALAIDAGTRGPVVDQAGRTSARGIFAAGNLVHAAEAAHVAAGGGARTAPAIAAFLATGDWPTPVPLACTPPLRWVSPNAITPGLASPPRLLVRIAEVRHGSLTALQGDRVLWRGRTSTLVPNRSIRVPASWCTRVEPGCGTLRLLVEP